MTNTKEVLETLGVEVRDATEEEQFKALHDEMIRRGYKKVGDSFIFDDTKLKQLVVNSVDNPRTDGGDPPSDFGHDDTFSIEERFGLPRVAFEFDTGSPFGASGLFIHEGNLNGTPPAHTIQLVAIIQYPAAGHHICVSRDMPEMVDIARRYKLDLNKLKPMKLRTDWSRKPYIWALRLDWKRYWTGMPSDISETWRLQST